MSKIHELHCCILHGCKYDEEDICPVVTKLTKQGYVCDQCRQEHIYSVERMEAIAIKLPNAKIATIYVTIHGIRFERRVTQEEINVVQKEMKIPSELKWEIEYDPSKKEMGKALFDFSVSSLT